MKARVRLSSVPGTQTRPQLLAKTVIGEGYCVGCGACAAAHPAAFKIELTAHGQLAAKPTGGPEPASAAKVCPFSDEALNEDELGAALFGQGAQLDPRIGYFLGAYAGHVVEEPFRRNGGSGGMGSWLLNELLTTNRVDAVIHVGAREPTPDDPRLFHYVVSDRPDQLLAGARSRYYPIELSEVLERVTQTERRYALTGLPCFIKSVRLLSSRERVFRDRIKYTVGLVCGHLKSRHFASSLAWQMGIAPSELRRFEFRHKQPGRPASDYSVEAEGRQQGTRQARARQLFGSDWGLGQFRYRACDFCDDVAAELADLTIGDAWLPGYTADWRGSNIVIVRNQELHKLVEEATQCGRLSLDKLSVDQIVESQAANYRHRRKGLSYRVYQQEALGRWAPRKRVPAKAFRGDPLWRLMNRLRTRLSESSHGLFAQAMEAGDPDYLRRKQRSTELLYHLANHRRQARFVKKKLQGARTAIRLALTATRRSRSTARGPRRP